MIDQSSLTVSPTRERIVETARQLFFRQGYQATGISQILKASKARSGSLYHFFPSKEDLLAAVLEKHKVLLEPAVLGPAADHETDPIEQLFAVLDGYRQLLESTEFQLGCPIGNLALEISNSHPRVRKLVVEYFDAWSLAIRKLIERAAGRLPPEIDPDGLARHVLATMEGAVMLARAYRSFEPFEHAVKQLRDYFDRLLSDGAEWSQERTP